MKVRIGELAKLTGCQAVTVRYYEKEGLLQASERTEGNYRLYGDKEIERLKFIRHCRLHGISLAEIHHLLDFNDNPQGNCEWVGALIQKHVDALDQRITDLQLLKRHLESLRDCCSDTQNGHCGIIDDLTQCNHCDYCEHSVRSDDVNPSSV